MRNLEAIENELSQAREALSRVKGTPSEVYSRIVGYYRSVRNWNRGKREEYGERLVYEPEHSLRTARELGIVEKTAGQTVPDCTQIHAGKRALLFVRATCPACPPAKAAVGRLGLPFDLVDVGTEEGLAEAVKRNVLSTPTAILVSSGGNEITRARTIEEINHLNETMPIAV
ncbi:MAG: hypothetical protein LBJ31_04735 [Treponema sp.]|jgi:ribonucleoside-triphosphate reductase|nr:hypothetical protein [Treponema sp.]